jgi:hypothetical protein
MHTSLVVCGVRAFLCCVLLVSVLAGVSTVEAVEPSTIANDAELLEGLVSYWPLDEEGGVRADVHGGNHLEAVGVVVGNSGIINNAARFSSANQSYLGISDSEQGGLDLESDYTLSVWINPESFPHDGAIFGKFLDFINLGQNINQRSYLAIITPDGLNSYISHDGTNYVGKTLRHVYDLNRWTHTVLVYYSALGMMVLYVDGKVVAEVDGYPNSIFNSNAKFFLGAYKDGGYGYFNGSLDEVGVWNRALTPEEVTKLYNEGKGLPYHASTPPEDAPSSVAFFPGIMGSRLYEEVENKEEKRWESIYVYDIAPLALHEDGESVVRGIYTRDIIDEIRPVTGLGSFGDAYRGWIEYMDGLVEAGDIHEWKALPYDWRMATNKLVTRGILLGSGHVSFTGTPDSTPYFIAELTALADRSPSGKVSIVAHSNGGLVAKNLIRYLEHVKHPLLARIDTLVLVASPQEGTPKAVREILHGIDMHGQQTLRGVLQNMAGAYGLLPSPHFAYSSEKPIVEVDESVKSLPVLSDLAGRALSTFQDVQSFLKGDAGTRNELSTLGYLHPNILNATLLAEAGDMHEEVDTYTYPAHIRVVEVVGTGLWTPYGVGYSAEQKKMQSGNLQEILRTEWRADTEGDGTVVRSSGRGADADRTYYFGLHEYNAYTKGNYAHGTILSTTPVQSLIQQTIVRKSDETPLFMNTVETSTSYPRFELRAYSPVDIHLYQGALHTGVTALTGEDFGRYFEMEIPNSHYEEWVDVKYVGAGLDTGSVDVVVQGTGDGYFTLELDFFEGDARMGTHVWQDIPVRTISRGTMVLGEDDEPTLEYDYDGDGTIDASLRSGESFEEAEEYAVSFEGLREAIRDAKAKVVVERWLLAKVYLAEGLYKKNTKGTITASKVALYLIAQQAKHVYAPFLGAQGAVIADLATRLAQSM